MKANKNTTAKTNNQVDPNVQARFDEVLKAIVAVDPLYNSWKNDLLKDARTDVRTGNLDGLNKIMGYLAKHQKEMTDLDSAAAEKARVAQEAEAVKLAAQAEAEAARKVVEAAKLAVQASVEEGWQKALKASRTWVESANADSYQGQRAFEIAFNSAFQKMAVRVAEVSYGDAEAVQALDIDLQGLVATVYQFQQNWCKVCGAPISDRITPKKGKPFTPSFCREHALATKALKQAEKMADSGALTEETVQALEIDPDFKGVTVELNRKTIIGGSSVSDYQSDPEPETELPLPLQKPRRRPARAAQAAEEEGAEDEGQIEKIGKARARK